VARRKISDLAPENQRIANAYDAAKRNNPSLTQAQFAGAVFGGRKRAPGKPYGGAPDTWTKRQRQADARYLRLILEGKRRPKSLLRRAESSGSINVAIRHGDAWSSFSIRLPRGVSRLDFISRWRESDEFAGVMKIAVRNWSARYDEGTELFDIDNPFMRSTKRIGRTPTQLRVAL
jgi:hypothetical protein